MAETQQTTITSAGRKWYQFWKAKKAVEISNAADSMFTKDPASIATAYDIHNDALVTRYKELRGAIAQFELGLDQKKQRAGDLHEKIAKKEKALNGALTVIEKQEGIAADETKSQDERDKAAAAAKDARTDAAAFKQDLVSLHASLTEIEGSLKDSEGRRQLLMKQLQDLKKKVEELPAEKAQAIGDFVSNKTILEALDKVGGLQTTVDRTPIDAIGKMNAELAAKVRVQQHITEGELNSDREKLYSEEGAASDAMDDINTMLAQRKAAREAKTGAGAPAAERQKI